MKPLTETALTARLRYMIGANGSLPPLEARALCAEVERLAAQLGAIHTLIPPPLPEPPRFDWTDEMKVQIFNLVRAKLYAPAEAPAPATDQRPATAREDRPTPAYGLRARDEIEGESSARANDCEQDEGA